LVRTWKHERKPRVLYLADRNILVDQPITREFVPVLGRDAVWKVRGQAKTGREIFFALYQAIAEGGRAGIFRDYPSDYFDLIWDDEAATTDVLSAGSASRSAAPSTISLGR